MALVGRRELVVDRIAAPAADPALEEARALLKTAASVRNSAYNAYVTAEKELELARSLLRRLESANTR